MRRLATVMLTTAMLVASCSLQTLGAPKGHLSVTATFDDAQHLLPGHAVRIADVKIGTVTKVALSGYRARVTLSIVDGRRIPTGTSAVIAQTSLLGENYVELQLPETFDPKRGPFVANGGDITNTSEQPELQQITQQGIDLLSAVSAGDLTKIVNALSEGLTGRGAELHQLISQLAQVGDVYAHEQDNLATIIDGLGKFGSQLAANAPDIGALISNLAGATSTLAAQRARVISTVQQLTGLAKVLNGDVLEPHASQLHTLLSQLAPSVTAIAGAKGTLENLITHLHSFVLDLPKANYQGALLLYIWVPFFVAPNGSHIPIPPLRAGTAAVTYLLRPTP